MENFESVKCKNCGNSLFVAVDTNCDSEKQEQVKCQECGEIVSRCQIRQQAGEIISKKVGKGIKKMFEDFSK